MARFSDEQLIQILQKAARRVNRRLSLTDTVDAVVVDASGNITSPNNEDLVDIVLLQSECMILNIDTNNDINNGGVLVVDGEQTLDTRIKSSSRVAYMGNDFNPCAELEKAINVELLKGTGDHARDVW